MNTRLARLLKLHGLYRAPAGDDGAVEDGGGDAVEVDEVQDGDDSDQDEAGESGSTDDGADDAQDGAADEADGVSISFGDEASANEEDQTRAPDWIRELRKSNRDKDRALREKDAEIARLRGDGTQAAKVEVGARPKLADFDFDEDNYGEALDAWHARKAAADAQKTQQEQETQRQQEQWSTRLEAVTKASDSLRMPDYEDAAAAFEGVFSPLQQGIVIGGPDDAKTSAALRYALGKNQTKARELAAIKDPVKFAVALGKLEMQLKTTPRKAAPAPDAAVRSNVAGAAAVDNQLERLREQARKTGDYSKVGDFNRRMEEKKRAASK